MPSPALPHGVHLTADLTGCDPTHPWMTQADALRQACLQRVAQVGLHTVGDHFYAFAPAAPGQAAGITGVVLLAESHLAVHTWPESGVVTLDVFVCNHSTDNTDKAHVLLQALLDGFAPAQVSRQAIRRGLPSA